MERNDSIVARAVEADARLLACGAALNEAMARADAYAPDTQGCTSK